MRGLGIKASAKELIPEWLEQSSFERGLRDGDRNVSGFLFLFLRRGGGRNYGT